MDVVLATIFDGGRAISRKQDEAVELNSFIYYFIDLYKTPPNRPRPTPSKDARIRSGVSIVNTP